MGSWFFPHRDMHSRTTALLIPRHAGHPVLCDLHTGQNKSDALDVGAVGSVRFRTCGQRDHSRWRHGVPGTVCYARCLCGKVLPTKDGPTPMRRHCFGHQRRNFVVLSRKEQVAPSNLILTILIELCMFWRPGPSTSLFLISGEPPESD